MIRQKYAQEVSVPKLNSIKKSIGKDLSYCFCSSEKAVKREECIDINELYKWDDFIADIESSAKEGKLDRLMVLSTVLGQLTFESPTSDSYIYINKVPMHRKITYNVLDSPTT